MLPLEPVGEGPSLPLPASGRPRCSLTGGSVTPVSTGRSPLSPQHLPSVHVCLCVQISPLYKSYWTGNRPTPVQPRPDHLQRPYFQIRSHSQVVEVRTQVIPSQSQTREGPCLLQTHSRHCRAEKAGHVEGEARSELGWGGARAGASGAAGGLHGLVNSAAGGRVQAQEVEGGYAAAQKGSSHAEPSERQKPASGCKCQQMPAVGQALGQVLVRLGQAKVPALPPPEGQAPAPGPSFCAV